MPDHKVLVLIKYTEMPIINTHADLPINANLGNFTGGHFHLISDENKMLLNISPFTLCQRWPTLA